ncbi:PLP-dependent aspartate aminotransferase family protein [Methylococcus sp. EFPC2]|uniref:trans-sulfuration enzyme family protein n=1 Tax=Methylococcus sp. EFPC2 TaxID=2812648 RepID=UPI001966FDB1|nr:PLP-dependent aspartate aminotransferase family protein [Methylococcus sp. EFPC2]QSA95816.1 PLP-dependent transferase [Methylococcus sp. EFPC2]
MPHDEHCHPDTLAARGLGDAEPPYYDIVPPLHLASTFERAADGGYPGGRVYARDASPAYDAAEALLCRLEQGAAAALFASGMAAATAVLLALRPGARVVAPQAMYWALRRWLIEFSTNWQITLDFYADGDELAELLGRPADLVWVETPANPTWEITDIARAADLAHAAGARLVVDSTVATPVFTRPLNLGADIVMHSATKYLNGHSDVVAGVLVARVEDELWARIKSTRASGGAILGPFEAWLLNRGLRTLFPRVRAAADSAASIAAHFEHHPAIAAVLYPGLPSHPGHDIAARQMEGGYGAMLSLRIRGGEDAARAVAARVRLFRRATSLGSVESLIEHRASVEGSGTRCPVDLLRVSVGIENVQDLINDLEQALRATAD